MLEESFMEKMVPREGRNSGQKTIFCGLRSIKEVKGGRVLLLKTVGGDRGGSFFGVGGKNRSKQGG